MKIRASDIVFNDEERFNCYSSVILYCKNEILLLQEKLTTLTKAKNPQSLFM